MSETLIIQTNSGPVRGRKREGTNGIVFYSFQCIPYAKPPVGKLRFKAPQPHEPWTDVHDATAPGPMAFQNPELFFADAIVFTQPKSEDCLHLDVYKKVLQDTTDYKLPVLVMFHGGGFTFGSSGEDQNSPLYLLEDDILYISINYRLGVHGFLSVPEREFDIPGNAGLKDQSLALRWVAENCQHFGGNSSNITIMGISAGAASVHYHLISDHSRNLFHRAIVQSGSALNPWASQPSNRDCNERLARALGWDGTGGRATMIRTIIEAPAERILEHQDFLATPLERIHGALALFVPIVEPYDNGTVFLDRDVSTMNRTAWSHTRIPLLVGGIAGEGYIMYREIIGGSVQFDDRGLFDNALPCGMNISPDEDAKRRRIGDALREFYYADEKPSVTNLDIYVDLLTDSWFWHGIIGIIKARLARAGSAPTYLYHFDYSSDVMTVMQRLFCGKPVERMVHAEDMLYQFYYPEIDEALPVDSVEVRLRKIYNSICTRFATTGRPSNPETEPLNWKPVSGPGPYKCLNIGKQLSVIDLPHTKRMQFWERLYNFSNETSDFE